MRDFTETLADLHRRVDDARAYLQIEAARTRLTELEQEASRADLWEDQEQARKVTTELARLRDDLELFDGLAERLSEVETLYQLGREEGDDSVEPEIDVGVGSLSSDLDTLELRALFTGEHDERDAICEVHSGAGGTDAQDWTEMLLRMYLRWAERRGFDVELDEAQEGTEAGITSATFIVKGRYAFGLLQGEKGVHRLIRISPFDANARRQTAFASFDAVPALEHSEEPEIDPNDLRIDTYRSSGAGGQHVNVTDSAVRITHLPTGIVVSCQNERSQIQNRAKAMQILAARLAERQRVERQQELESLAGEKKDVAFGSQIRTYTLAPYQLVKDERTRHETGNVQAVLDGELDPFIEAYLQWRRRHDGGAPSPSGPHEGSTGS
jgi:peptide chain release factor 2